VSKYLFVRMRSRNIFGLSAMFHFPYINCTNVLGRFDPEDKVAKILVNKQPDALFHVFIYLFPLFTCFEHQVLIIRRSNCINTSSGMISLCK